MKHVVDLAASLRETYPSRFRDLPRHLVVSTSDHFHAVDPGSREDAKDQIAQQSLSSLLKHKSPTQPHSLHDASRSLLCRNAYGRHLSSALNSQRSFRTPAFIYRSALNCSKDLDAAVGPTHQPHCATPLAAAVGLLRTLAHPGFHNSTVRDTDTPAQALVGCGCTAEPRFAEQPDGLEHAWYNDGVSINGLRPSYGSRHAERYQHVSVPFTISSAKRWMVQSGAYNAL